MCIYKYIIYVYINLCIYKYMYIYINMYIYKYVYINIYIEIYVYRRVTSFGFDGTK